MDYFAVSTDDEEEMNNFAVSADDEEVDYFPVQSLPYCTLMISVNPLYFLICKALVVDSSWAQKRAIVS